MAQNLDLNINVNTDQAGKSIGSLKSQLREAQADVVKLSDKFGATSKEAIEAAKRAAELRDRIGDARALTEAFNPDAKFKALTASLSGVAGGFAAVQGAMALFGSESEDLQKTLVKVQSAMALSQGLQAVGESIDSFKQLGAVIRTQVVSAFSTLRGAIIATGVGALAVGLGLLIANFEKVKETLTNLFPGLIEFGNQIKNIVQGITDFVGITSEAARVQDNFKLSIETSNKAIDNQIKILEAQGGKEDEIYKKKRERILNQIKLVKDTTDEERQKRADLNTELQVLDLNEANRIKKANETAAKERKDASDKREAEEKARIEKAQADARAYEQFDTELQQRLMQLDEERAEKKRALDFQNIQNLITDIDYENDLLDIDFEADQQRLANKEAYIAEQKAIELSNLELSEKERLEIIAKYAKQEQDIDKDITASKKAEQEAKTAMELQYLGFAEQAGNLLGQIAGKNKSVAIAGLLIEKGAAIAKIITQMNTVPAILPPGIPNPAFIPSRIGGALSIASVIAASVNGIQQINQAGNGGTGTSSVPAISTQAPMIPQLPVAQTTNISRESINDLGNQAVRAYVIETDITGNQQRMAAIRQRARFS
jgi:hypothetical protein